MSQTDDLDDLLQDISERPTPGTVKREYLVKFDRPSLLALDLVLKRNRDLCDDRAAGILYCVREQSDLVRSDPVALLLRGACVHLVRRGNLRQRNELVGLPFSVDADGERRLVSLKNGYSLRFVSEACRLAVRLQNYEESQREVPGCG